MLPRSFLLTIKGLVISILLPNIPYKLLSNNLTINYSEPLLYCFTSYKSLMYSANILSLSLPPP